MKLELMNTSFDFYLQIIDDPSGNSFIENPFVPQKDTAITVTHYKRTPEHNAALGIEVRSCYSICCWLQLSVLWVRERQDFSFFNFLLSLYKDRGRKAWQWSRHNEKWGISVQHKLPRMQRPGQYKHEACSYPLKYARKLHTFSNDSLCGKLLKKNTLWKWHCITMLLGEMVHKSSLTIVHHNLKKVVY